MSNCLTCDGDAEPFMSFGKMPIANGFLTPAEFSAEKFFDLTVAFCDRCAMVQLTAPLNREVLFNDAYPFFSSTSAHMAAHFESFARQVVTHLRPLPDPLVVEIGSNDGVMLRHFAGAGVRHLGIEPSASVAKVAAAQGLHVLTKFFDATVAAEILLQHGQADAILAANVMCHVPYIHSVMQGITRLLKPHGVLMFEDPYLGAIVERVSYDQIYDEHALYFSATSVSRLVKPHGLELVDLSATDVHGGSMRYVVAHTGARTVSADVVRALEREKAQGLDRLETFAMLRRRIELSRDRLVSLLHQQKQHGKRVVGYGATSKSTTVTNYCGITQDLVEFICDTTPVKQGKFSPGTHIPIRAHAEFAARYPDYALLFAWNHAKEIMAKEESFKAAGGKWLAYVPEVQVLA